MSDIQSLTVILDRAVREDDARPLVDAILRLRGVQDVTFGEPVDARDFVNRRIAITGVVTTLWDVLRLADNDQAWAKLRRLVSDLSEEPKP